MPLPNQLPQSQHLALATLTPWLFLLPHSLLWCLFHATVAVGPPSLRSSRAGLSLTTVFALRSFQKARFQALHSEAAP